MTSKEAANEYPQIFEYNSNTGRLMVFLDNHLLSTCRKCEMFFIEEFKNNLRPKGVTGQQWNLLFGAFWHKLMEEMFSYKIEHKKLKPLNEMITYTQRLWYTLEWKMEQFADIKAFQEIGGLDGVLIMLIEFMKVFDNDKFEIIATEMAFGRDREVPILDWRITGHDSHIINKYDLDMYLVGRPDLVISNGQRIGPLDFKTAGRFTGREQNMYKPYDELAGYVYAIDYILGNKYKSRGFSCDIAFVVCVLKSSSEKIEKKSLSFPVSYTRSELEEYRLRQISTFNRIYELLVLGEIPQWNTQLCNNDFYHDCQYKPLHNISLRDRQLIINGNFIKTERWNPTTRIK